VPDGQPDTQKMPSTVNKLRSWHRNETNKPYYSSNLSDRLEKVIKSALRLRNRQRDMTLGTEDEESRIR
jgi:hypothetical protein